MQEFLADLHIHSRFSRATSTKLTAPLLAAWAQLKGLAVLGTGDFTHPKWREELRTSLRFDEKSGLYLLRDTEQAAASLPELPVPSLTERNRKNLEDTTGYAVPPAHFMLQGEISSIYKRGGKVRKVHNLVYMPTIEAAEAFSHRLEQIGNLHSDGRPILGLDSRDLLEMVLEADPRAFLVPAHIWTPWFSVFGSKSGFDALEECYGDLTSEIFALETGLSSDPAMNRLWSALDNYRLISNSDAHSGENIGREANVFSGTLSYDGILTALKSPQQASSTLFRGTVEFFPDEGKYHRDGHRKCNVVLSPDETRKVDGICPVCGTPLTVGVLYRVMELADRSTPHYQGETDFASLVPLTEVLGEVLGVGPKSRKVGAMYTRLLERFGPELTILQHCTEQELSHFFPPLGESIGRMRRGEVQLQGGYDGEYGVVRMFSDAEREEIVRATGGTIRKKNGKPQVQHIPLMAASVSSGADDAKKKSKEDAINESCCSEEFSFFTEDLPAKKASENAPVEITTPLLLENPQKLLQEAEAHTGKALALALEKVRIGHVSTSVRKPAHTITNLREALHPHSAQPKAETPENGHPSQGLNPSQEQAVMAGPGSVLVLAGPGTGKTRTLVARIATLLEEGMSARRILAVTFTRRAATEMDERLKAALGRDAPLPRTDTLHALALELWHKTNADVPVLLSEESAKRVFAEANAEESRQLIRDGWEAISLAREKREIPPPEYAHMAERYLSQKTAWNLADYTDLLEFWLEQVSGGMHPSRWLHVLVDEVQDLSPLQLTLIRSLLPPTGDGFFGIGDPDQSIYGFRGAHGQCHDFFATAWPNITLISLTHNYRTQAGILAAAHAALDKQAVSPQLVPTRKQSAAIALFTATTAFAEARWVAERVAALIGAGSHTLLDNALPKDAAATKGATALPDPATFFAGQCSPNDIAILVRTHTLASFFRNALEQVGVPVAAPAMDAFWADERIAHILRTAGRMLGIAVLGDAEGDMPPLCPDKILAKGPLGVAAYLSTIPPFDALFWQSAAFRALIKAYDVHGGWAELITWISLQNELELVRAKGEKIRILSLHASKGLEFRVVFMPCLEDGLLPFSGPELLTGKLVDKKPLTELSEERRLFYVGMTRAKDALFLSHAAQRSLYGKELRLKPSRFLQTLPPESLLHSALVAHTTRNEKQLTLF